MSNPWINEFWRLTVLVGIAFVFGWPTDTTGILLILILLGYFIWNVYNLYRLERWYRSKKRKPPPHTGGIWGQVFDHAYRMQQSDLKRKRRLASIVNRFNESTTAMPDATVILDEQGCIQWINKAARSYLGLKTKQDTGQRIVNLIRNPAFVEYFNKGDFTHPLELSSPMKDGRFLLFHVIPYGNHQRLMVVRDITRLKHLERVRQDFVANVSHELRTPLTVINGYLENILDADDDCAQRWGKSLDQMQTQSRRMTRIVEDLLLLSRLDANEKTDIRDPVAVPNIIHGISEQAELLSGEKHHVFKIEVDSRLWLYGNEKLLHSIFGNLIFNAVQYTPAGGEITIRWFQEGNAIFEVRDTGIGIAPEHIARLTERFYRVDPGRSRDVGGTGLGLAIVSHALSRHQGKLEIESAPGEGSCFRAKFPETFVLRRDE